MDPPQSWTPNRHHAGAGAAATAQRPTTPGSTLLVEGDGGGGRIAPPVCKLPRLGHGGAASLGLLAAIQAARPPCGRGSAPGATVAASGAEICGPEIPRSGGLPEGQLLDGSKGTAGEAPADSTSSAPAVTAQTHNVVHDVLTSEFLFCKVLGFLDHKHVYLAIGTCCKFRQLAAGLDERDGDSGAVNWPAFRHLGVLRKKKHSMVIKCQSRATNTVLVVKRIQTRVCPSTGEAQDQHQDQGFPVRYLREVALLRAVDHPNVMRLHQVFYRDDRLELFSEFVGQNLEDYIAQEAEEAAYQVGSTRHTVMMGECRSFVRQILEGVSYCHSVGILLRDIKPRNVMRDWADPCRVKLTGLALGRFASLPSEALTREVVTQCYRAPEILLGGSRPIYSAPVDIWSVGCTLAEIACGRTLFEGDSEIGQLFQIYRVLGTPDEHSWPGVSLLPDFLAEAPMWAPQDLRQKVPGLCKCEIEGSWVVGGDVHDCSCGLHLLGQMLRYNPCGRISAKAALRHPYLELGTPRVNNLEKREGGVGRMRGELATACASDRAGLQDEPRVEAADSAFSETAQRLLAGDWYGSDSDAQRLQISTATAAYFHEYAGDLCNHLLKRHHLCLPESICATQLWWNTPKSFAEDRRQVVDWLAAIFEQDGIKSETLFLSINIFDRVLARRRILADEIKLVAVTAILIASKHEELAPQGVQNLVMRLPGSTCEEILAMEASILRQLDYNITLLTPLRTLEMLRISVVLDADFFGRHHRACTPPAQTDTTAAGKTPNASGGGGASACSYGCGGGWGATAEMDTLEGWPKRLGIDVWEVARYLLQLALREFDQVCEAPHVLAAAAALLALHTLHLRQRSAQAQPTTAVPPCKAKDGSGTAPHVPLEAETRERDLLAKHIHALLGRSIDADVGMSHDGPTPRQHEHLDPQDWLRIGSVMRRLHGYQRNTGKVLGNFPHSRARAGLGDSLRGVGDASMLPTCVSFAGSTFLLQHPGRGSTTLNNRTPTQVSSTPYVNHRTNFFKEKYEDFS